MEMLLGVPPLDLFIEFEIGRSYLRLRAQLTGPLYPSDEWGHLGAAKRIFQTMGVDPERVDFCSERVDKRSFAVQLFSFSSGRVTNADRLNVFTDGSKLPEGSTGLGVYYNPHPGDEVSFGKFVGSSATVFQAEVQAITEACHLLTASLASNQEVSNAITIYSDSQAALQALSSRWIKSKVVRECVTALNELGRFTSLRLRWVKAHIGIPGNEKADQLARRAAASPPRGPVESLPIAPAVTASHLKEWLMGAWQSRWESLPEGFARQSRIWFTEPTPRKTRRILALGRVNFGRVIRWLTGHVFLRLQNFRAGTSAISVCRLCGQKPERADHILLECPRLGELRMDCFGSAYIDTDEERPDWEVGDLLEFLAAAGVANLEEEEDKNVDEEIATSSASDAPPPVCRRQPHTISTSDSG